MILAGVLILIAGVVGEWQAILALYNQSVSHDAPARVLRALFILVIAVVLSPALRLVAAPLLYPRKETEGPAAATARQAPGDDSEGSPK
jgi:hypothetical protein